MAARVVWPLALLEKAFRSVATSSRRQILDLISRRSQTVAELSVSVDVTGNAVMVQLQQLEADGLVRRDWRQRTGGAGKPGYEYEIVPGTEDRLSQDYRPVLEQLVVVLGRRMPSQTVSEILEEARRGLAHCADFSSLEDPRARLKKSLEIVNGLGACAEIVDDESGAVVIENRRRPFATAVRPDATVCHAA